MSGIKGKSGKYIRKSPISSKTRKKIGEFQKESWKLGIRKGHPFTLKARKKMSESNKGEKAPRWKGGISKEYIRIRMGIEWRLWRESVFARDSWTCQKCNQIGGDIHPHHIKSFAKYPELRFAIDNGITFCKKCHRKFHQIYGKEKAIEKDLEEFLGRKT